MRVMNAVEGFTDASGQFHPIRGSADYEPGRIGHSVRKGKKKKAGKGRKVKTKRKATARKKKPARKVAGISRSSRLVRKAKKAVASGRKRNPLPIGKFVTAKVRRRPGGQIDVLVEKKKKR